MEQLNSRQRLYRGWTWRETYFTHESANIGYYSRQLIYRGWTWRECHFTRKPPNIRANGPAQRSCQEVLRNPGGEITPYGHCPEGTRVPAHEYQAKE
jgi:hypothetical protein